MVRLNIALTKDFCIELSEHGSLEQFLKEELEKYIVEEKEKYSVFILSCNRREELGDILFKFIGQPSSERTIYLGDIANKLKIKLFPDGNKDIIFNMPPVLYIPKSTDSEEIKLEILKIMENIQKKNENFLHNYFDKKAREEEKKKLLKKETRYEYDEKELLK